MSQPAISSRVAGLPSPSFPVGCAAAQTAAKTQNTATVEVERRLLRSDLNIAHFTGRFDTPCLDCVVVVDRSRAAHRAEVTVGRLNVAGFVDDARLQQRAAAVPGPVDPK